jgi:hypothetical protein
MKKPKTFKELIEIVNPEDLLEVLDFSGINDHRDKEHSELKRKYSELVYNSKGQFGWKRMGYIRFETPEEFYDTIIKCIQDFYYWSHQFSHIYAHIYKRVINALEIPIEEITPIMDERIHSCDNCEFWGECDHQGAYKKEGKWCFE